MGARTSGVLWVLGVFGVFRMILGDGARYSFDLDVIAQWRTRNLAADFRMAKEAAGREVCARIQPGGIT